MAKAKYQDWILETIDQLRKRKARPDLERICHMVERKHGPSLGEIKRDLQILVDSGIVFKVDYKGSTSYRNAAKLKRGPAAGGVHNIHDLGRKILDAVRTLTEPVSDCGSGEEEENGSTQAQQPGVSFGDIENWMLGEESDTDWVENSLENALRWEVDGGYLKKLPNGNYLFVSEEPQPKTLATPEKTQTPVKTPSKGNRPKIRGAKSEQDGSKHQHGKTSTKKGKGGLKKKVGADL